MMTILGPIVGFIVTLGLLVLVHEWGHYRVARFFNVKVERFSIGFGKILWRHKGKETEWCLSAVPLGGYVKFTDTRESETPVAPQDLPRAFDRQSVGKRAAIVAAGPLINLLFAALIYAAIAFIGTYEPTATLGAPPASTQAAAEGIAPGDKIESISGHAIRSLNDVSWQLTREVGRSDIPVTFIRPDGIQYTRIFNLAGMSMDSLATESPLTYLGFTLYRPNPTIVRVEKDTPAERAGLVRGDQVLSVDGRAVKSLDELIEMIKTSKGSPMTFDIKNIETQQSKHVTITPALVRLDDGKEVVRIGVALGAMPEMVRVTAGPIEAVGIGFTKTWEMISLTFKSIGTMIVGEASVKNISGPVAIADYAAQAASIGLIPFLSFLAMISISLGVLNLLPIPVLDGGHLLFFAIEAIKGKALSPNVVMNAIKVGMILVLALSVLAISNDLSKYIG